MEQLRQRLGITREETLVANIAKLSERYKGLTYSDQAAHDRADKAPERQYFGKPQAEPVVIPHTQLDPKRHSSEVTG